MQQQREREILEQAVHAIAQRANSASQIIDEAYAAGPPSDHPVTIQAKRLRPELLQIKGELERSLEDFSLTCTACGLDVHWMGMSETCLATGGIESQRHTGNRSSNLDSLVILNRQFCGPSQSRSVLSRRGRWS